MAMFKGGKGGVLVGMAGNMVVVNYRIGNVVVKTKRLIWIIISHQPL